MHQSLRRSRTSKCWFSAAPTRSAGCKVEGTVLNPEYASFVGLHPLPTRHGMTLGEIAMYFQKSFYPSAEVEVVLVQNWSRGDYLFDTGILELPLLQTCPRSTPPSSIRAGAFSRSTNLRRGAEARPRPFGNLWSALDRRLEAGRCFERPQAAGHALSADSVPAEHFQREFASRSSVRAVSCTCPIGARSSRSSHTRRFSKKSVANAAICSSGTNRLTSTNK